MIIKLIYALKIMINKYSIIIVNKILVKKNNVIQNSVEIILRIYVKVKN